MKIRTGFVSNSSASSFCIWGAKIKLDELVKMVDADIPEMVPGCSHEFDRT